MTNGTEGTIVIQRTHRIYNARAATFKIMIDGKKEGGVRDGQTVSLGLPAGEHCVQISANPTYRSRKILIRVNIGDEIRLACSADVIRIGLKVDKIISARVVEVERCEAPIGNDEIRTIDNSGGVSPMVRTFRVSREWTRSYTLGSVQSTSAARSAELSSKLGTLKSQAEQKIEQQYSIMGQERRTFEDTVTITTAPRTYSEVRFAWKEVRQRGCVEFNDGADAIWKVPFELVLGLTFDPKQTDKTVS
jgi:hypothetical protein